MFPKKKSIFRKIVESKTLEFRLIKRILSSLMGFAVGYVYYSISFSQAFQPDEAYYSNIVKWVVLSLCAVGSFFSVQCCCIASLCIPTLAAKSGRKVLQAALFTWIMAGPVSNIFYHSTEAIRAVTCVARLQVNQTKMMVDLLTAPIKRGQSLIVNESESLPLAQHQLEEEMTGLRKELLVGIFGESDMPAYSHTAKQRTRRRRRQNALFLRELRGKRTADERRRKDLELEDENEREVIRDEENIAASLRNERTKMCHGSWRMLL